MSNEQQDLTGNWRTKAYEKQGMSPYRGHFVQEAPTEGEQPDGAAMYAFLNSLKAELNKEEGGIQPEHVPTPEEPTMKPSEKLRSVLEQVRAEEDEAWARRFSAQSAAMAMATVAAEAARREMLQPSAEPWEEEMDSIFQEALFLFVTKNTEYGNAFVSTGALGSAVALTGDVARLRKMLVSSGGLVLQSQLPNIRDKFMDVLVQAAMGILMIDQHNIVGK